MMNKKELFSVGLKYIAVGFFIFNFSKFLFEIMGDLFIVHIYSSYPVLSLFTIAKIIIIGMVSYLLFINSEKIINKFTTDNSETNITKRFILQVAIIIECVSSIVYSVFNFAILIIDNIFQLPDMAVPVEYKGIITAYIVGFIISVMILIYNEKIASYIAKKIPNKLWSD